MASSLVAPRSGTSQLCVYVRRPCQHLVNVQENDASNDVQENDDASNDASGLAAELPSSWEDADATGPASELSAQDEEWEDDGARPSPPLDETSVFAACLHEYGEETLPNSTTTKGAAILPISPGGLVAAHQRPVWPETRSATYKRVPVP